MSNRKSHPKSYDAPPLAKPALQKSNNLSDATLIHSTTIQKSTGSRQERQSRVPRPASCCNEKHRPAILESTTSILFACFDRIWPRRYRVCRLNRISWASPWTFVHAKGSVNRQAYALFAVKNNCQECCKIWGCSNGRKMMFSHRRRSLLFENCRVVLYIYIYIYSCVVYQLQ